MYNGKTKKHKISDSFLESVIGIHSYVTDVSFDDDCSRSHSVQQGSILGRFYFHWESVPIVQQSTSRHISSSSLIFSEIDVVLWFSSDLTSVYEWCSSNGLKLNPIVDRMRYC